MNVQTIWVSLFAGLAIATSIAYLPRCAAADPTDALLSGTNTPNFTVTYDVVGHNKLEDETTEQLHEQVANGFKKLNQDMIVLHEQQLPDNVEQNMEHQVLFQRNYRKDDRFQLTISVSGNRMLVRRYSRKTSQLFIFLYDGSRSMNGFSKSNFMIDSGFNYEYLHTFVFPGFGIAGIPLAKAVTMPGNPGGYLAKQLQAMEGDEAKTNGLELLPGNGKVWYVAMADGNSEKGGLPQYVPGFIRTASVDGRTCVSEAHGGYHRVSEQDCVYSDYRMIAQNLMLPGVIDLTESNRPGDILPFGPFYSIQYTLLKASPTALPDSEFTFDNLLQESHLVQNNMQKQAKSIRYVPGKSLDEQFKEADKRDKQSAMRNAPSRPAGSWTTAAGLLAIIAALIGWVLYRRTTRRS